MTIGIYVYMTFERSHMGYFIAFLVIGAILGSALGTFFAKLFRVLSIIKVKLTEPIGFNLEIISFSSRLNLAALVGLVTGALIFRRI